MNTNLRLLLAAALVLLLLTGIVAAWAHPPQWQSPNTAVPAGAAGSEPCDLVIGPARDWCTRGPATAATVTGTASAATAIPAASDGHNGLMVCATLAIPAAIALALTVERRAR
ncbi:hypothetical protein [Streptomyces roseus]|uniref:Uncharacterized protein n=1 Tax=Streptomyces roseus TaxID=66430 RepID=A0A0J6XJ23_9ACTN|nr:hypothetical protein [Streptomyces roseus]KMO96020.1 hypothetical protein ACS04_20225 [Streptomyces roseus]